MNKVESFPSISLKMYAAMVGCDGSLTQSPVSEVFIVAFCRLRCHDYGHVLKMFLHNGDNVKSSPSKRKHSQFSVRGISSSRYISFNSS